MIRDFIDAVYRDLTPLGTLRAAFSYGNPVISRRDAATGEPRGLAADCAEELGRKLSVPCTLLGYDDITRMLDAGCSGDWDLAFLSIESARAAQLHFTAPLVTLESTYLVRDDSPYRTAFDLDRPGLRVAVAHGGFHDLHLTRALRHATVERAATLSTAIDRFLHEPIDAVAGLRQPLAAYAASQPGLRVLDGRFAAIEVVLAVREGRSAGLRYLNLFVEQMKSGGWIAASLEQTLEKTAVAMASKAAW